ncbi:phosphatidylglycerophosphatase A [Arachidicoccus ginsenosidimutans]|uniref:phosphatidylglycerophosphatase A family protein n=1 Tax=Arachidicoccus sp. BS20 TaxID=1850526 RepID=UPI0007F107AD|nr:phosphatidylglycerophosphatase A [Arachidicoccus sp. BS20]ANI90473.1 phosphatidylglycerophosphatase A [Arachidicoccus sp. BS20]
MLIHKIISTFFGVGFVKKGGGTVAALITVLIWYGVSTKLDIGIFTQIIIIVVLFVLGVWSSNKVEAIWGKDSYRVVLDEVLGMCVALFVIPVTWQTALAALILFRVFDIAKPFYIRRMEKFPGGWGVMADDVLAGIYANIILQLILVFHLL